MFHKHHVAAPDVVRVLHGRAVAAIINHALQPLSLFAEFPHKFVDKFLFLGLLAQQIRQQAKAAHLAVPKLGQGEKLVQSIFHIPMILFLAGEGVQLCTSPEAVGIIVGFVVAAGAAALSDDGRPVKNARIMGEAMIKAHYAGLRVISHCEDLDIINGGIINAGKISKELGVKGMSRTSENIVTCREIQLANDLEMPIHIAHVSTKEVVTLLRNAVKHGIMVTSETAPHYFTLTEEKLLSRDADYRMNPPLRCDEDVKAITEAVIDGTIDCIVTDHAPHSAEEKADFEKAPNGVVGLETSLAATLTQLYHTGRMSLMKIVRMMCETPRRLLGIEGGSLEEGNAADIAIVDLDEEWTVVPEKLHSKSKNTCFKGMTFKGKVKYTIVNGNVVFMDK